MNDIIDNYFDDETLDILMEERKDLIFILVCELISLTILVVNI